MVTTNVRAATREAQAMLGDLELDGKWGKFTESRFRAASADMQERIRRVLSGRFNTSPEQLYTERKSRASYISREEAYALIDSLAVMAGVNAYRAEMKDFLNREAAKGSLNGRPAYLVTSKNGSSRGLMQIQPGAWETVLRNNPHLASQIGGYENVYDARTNILVGMLYARWVADRIKSKVPITGETLYLGYNQGPGFFLGWRDRSGVRHPPGSTIGLESQSKEVQEMIIRWSKYLRASGRV